jgi:hypothetical protein
MMSGLRASSADFGNRSWRLNELRPLPLTQVYDDLLKRAATAS